MSTTTTTTVTSAKADGSTTTVTTTVAAPVPPASGAGESVLSTLYYLSRYHYSKTTNRDVNNRRTAAGVINHGGRGLVATQKPHKVRITVPPPACPGPACVPPCARRRAASPQPVCRLPPAVATPPGLPPRRVAWSCCRASPPGLAAGSRRRALPACFAAVLCGLTRRPGVAGQVAFGVVPGESRASEGHTPITPAIHRDDPWFWLRDDSRESEEVLAHLRKENEAGAKATEAIDPLRAELYVESGSASSLLVFKPHQYHHCDVANSVCVGRQQVRRAQGPLEGDGFGAAVPARRLLLLHPYRGGQVLHHPLPQGMPPPPLCLGTLASGHPQALRTAVP